MDKKLKLLALLSLMISVVNDAQPAALRNLQNVAVAGTNAGRVIAARGLSKGVPEAAKLEKLVLAKQKTLTQSSPPEYSEPIRDTLGYVFHGPEWLARDNWLAQSKKARALKALQKKLSGEELLPRAFYANKEKLKGLLYALRNDQKFLTEFVETEQRLQREQDTRKERWADDIKRDAQTRYLVENPSDSMKIRKKSSLDDYVNALGLAFRTTVFGPKVEMEYKKNRVLSLNRAQWTDDYKGHDERDIYARKFADDVEYQALLADVLKEDPAFSEVLSQHNKEMKRITSRDEKPSLSLEDVIRHTKWSRRFSKQLDKDVRDATLTVYWGKKILDAIMASIGLSQL